MSHGTTVWVLYVSLKGWGKSIGQENDLRPEGMCWVYERVGRESTGACAWLSLHTHMESVSVTVPGST